MPKAIDINAALKTVTPMRNRGLQTTENEEDSAFAILEKFDNGAIFTGSFDGESPWERHRGGDELVHILDGETRLIILVQDTEEVLTLKTGMLAVVPKGCWHRFHAPKGVTLLTVTPQPTDHSSAEDPR